MLSVIDPFPTSSGTSRSLRSNVHPLAADLIVGVVAAACTALLRIGIEFVAGGVAPFILTFPAVMVATLLRGGRAGAIATLLCQILTIRFVFPNWVSIHGDMLTDYANILLSTMALAGMVWATASYRNTAAQLRARCQHQVRTLSLLMTEADHRTKNNFQVAAGLLAYQSINAAGTELADHLNAASIRLEVMASAYEGLPIDGTDQSGVDLDDHLERIVAVLRSASTLEHVKLIYRADRIKVPLETAIITGLIVNEWVVNALKYAFDGGGGNIFIDVSEKDGAREIVVDDDGDLLIPANNAGRGGELVAALADVLKASISVTRDNGTRCALTLRA